MNNSLDSNVLGVNYNGSVVENFYHPYKAIFSDDVKRLKLRHYQNNKYILLFMKTIILQQKIKYAYGYKFNATRMKEQIILLPSKDDGTPDYDFMEQYMKRQENMVISKIKQEEAGR
ncbi:MAG: restriction endonuclease subunit S [Vagococcus sp.]|nr:restriction endonuclease subunit S [Vagococcus sp.]